MSDRKLTDDELVEYIAIELATSMSQATSMEREADLEVARAENKRCLARGMKFQARLIERLGINSDIEEIDRKTGDIVPLKVKPATK